MKEEERNGKVFKILASEGQPLAGYHLNIALDQVTGVQYIILQSTRGVAITPRLNLKGELHFDSDSMKAINE